MFAQALGGSNVLPIFGKIIVFLQQEKFFPKNMWDVFLS